MELPHSTRCPHCNGLNDLDAEWCMQCTRRLKPLADKIEETVDADDSSGLVGRVASLLGEHPKEEDESEEAMSWTFAVQGRKVTWSCAKCGFLNDIRASKCADCGQPYLASAHSFAAFEIEVKKSRSMLKAFGIVSTAAVVFKLMAGLISPWAAGAVLAAALVHPLLRWLSR